ncbi:MAG: hypothetical protein U0271_26395 [Polyangiaceae bacterium]
MTLLRALRAYRELLVVLAMTVLALLGHRGRAEATVSKDEPPKTWSRSVDLGGSVADAPSLDELDREAEETMTAETTAQPLLSGAAATGSPLPEKVLLLGDSMVEVLSPSFAAYAKAAGWELSLAIWYGSTTAAWAEGPHLAGLLHRVKPTLVVVALGSSELTARKPMERRPYVEAIVRRVGARKLVWIGPPSWREDTGIVSLLEDAVGKDRYFHSDRLELTRKKDGIHPDKEGGQRWMHAVADWLGAESRYGLALTTPNAPAPPVPAIVIGSM